MLSKAKHKVKFNELKWDTDHFGVSCAKVILEDSLSTKEWVNIENKIKEYQFISIVNRNSDPVNAQLIAKHTSAFLADINIQFTKKVEPTVKIKNAITLHSSLERNDQILELVNFEYSKFIEDTELAKRGGNKVYHKWLLNSFGKPDKFYALSQDESNMINGFILYSFIDETCVIELIVVSKKCTKGGIGTNLFKSVEFDCYQRGIIDIKVGTQLRNLGAINFYHKLGCKQVECHQIYHLWNL